MAEKEASLDELDLRIIDLLEENSRRTYAEIARETSMSPGGVRKRVEKLTRNGIVKLVAVTDPARFGFLRAGIGVRVKGVPTAEVADAIATMDEVEWLSLSIGVYDLWVGALCRDQRGVYMLGDAIRSLPGVNQVDILTHVAIVKDAYALHQVISRLQALA